MSTDLKYFKDDQVPSLKEQAIAHWKENLKRVKAMDWRKWRRAHDITRREVVFSTVGNKYPHIGGEACPYCIRYHWYCKTVEGVQCPLKQEDIPGGCCVAWLNVREALIVPWNKVQTVTAIKAMIEYIKEEG